MTAAPSVQDIVMLAERINAFALQGYRVQLPDRAATQMYSAIPGAPGRGLQIFQDALHAKVAVRTNDDGDWLFFVQRQPPTPSASRRPGPLLATTSDTPAGRPS